MPEALEDLAHWVRTDPRLALRTIDLIEAALRDPGRGIGKPEALRHLEGHVWSRRIDREHRLVYRVGDEAITILQCRYHYRRA
jgi:toxin YoeB